MKHFFIKVTNSDNKAVHVNISNIFTIADVTPEDGLHTLIKFGHQHAMFVKETSSDILALIAKAQA